MSALGEVEDGELAFGTVGFVELFFVVIFFGGTKKPVVGSRKAEHGHHGNEDCGQPDKPAGRPIPGSGLHGEKERYEEEGVLEDGFGRVDSDEGTHAMAVVGTADIEGVAQEQREAEEQEQGTDIYACSPDVGQESEAHQEFGDDDESGREEGKVEGKDVVGEDVDLKLVDADELEDGGGYKKET